MTSKTDVIIKDGIDPSIEDKLNRIDKSAKSADRSLKKVSSSLKELNARKALRLTTRIEKLRDVTSELANEAQSASKTYVDIFKQMNHTTTAMRGMAKEMRTYFIPARRSANAYLTTLNKIIAKQKAVKAQPATVKRIVEEVNLQTRQRRTQQPQQNAGTTSGPDAAELARRKTAIERLKVAEEAHKRSILSTAKAQAALSKAHNSTARAAVSLQADEARLAATIAHLGVTEEQLAKVTRRTSQISADARKAEQRATQRSVEQIRGLSRARSIDEDAAASLSMTVNELAMSNQRLTQELLRSRAETHAVEMAETNSQAARVRLATATERLTAAESARTTAAARSATAEVTLANAEARSTATAEHRAQARISTTEQIAAAEQAADRAARRAAASLGAVTTEEEIRRAERYARAVNTIALAHERLVQMQARTRQITAQAELSERRLETRGTQLVSSHRRLLQHMASIAAATATLGFALAGIARAADSYTIIQNKLRVVTDDVGQLNRVSRRLFNIAVETRTPMLATAEAFSRFDFALKNMGESQRTSLALTEAVNRALVVSGVTTQEASSSLIQLSQAFNKGKLDGDEFRSMMENMRVLAPALMKQIGASTRYELFQMSRKGKISARAVKDAFLAISYDLKKQMEAMPRTIEQSFEAVKTRAVQALGELNRATGFTTSVTSGLLTIADNMRSIIPIAVSVGSALAAAFSITLLNRYATRVLGVSLSLGSLRGAALRARTGLVAMSAGGAGMSRIARVVTFIRRGVRGLLGLLPRLVAFLAMVARANPVTAAAATAGTVATSVVASYKPVLDSIRSMEDELENLRRKRDIIKKRLDSSALTNAARASTQAELNKAIREEATLRKEISDKVTEAGDRLRSFSTIDAAGTVQTLRYEVTNTDYAMAAVKAGWTGIKSAGEVAWRGIKSVSEEAWDFMKNAAKPAWDKVNADYLKPFLENLTKLAIKAAGIFPVLAGGIAKVKNVLTHDFWHQFGIRSKALANGITGYFKLTNKELEDYRKNQKELAKESAKIDAATEKRKKSAEASAKALLSNSPSELAAKALSPIAKIADERARDRARGEREAALRDKDLERQKAAIKQADEMAKKLAKVRDSVNNLKRSAENELAVVSLLPEQRAAETAGLKMAAIYTKAKVAVDKDEVKAYKDKIALLNAQKAVQSKMDSIYKGVTASGKDYANTLAAIQKLSAHGVLSSNQREAELKRARALFDKATDSAYNLKQALKDVYSTLDKTGASEAGQLAVNTAKKDVLTRGAAAPSVDESKIRALAEELYQVKKLKDEYTQVSAALSNGVKSYTRHLQVLSVLLSKNAISMSVFRREAVKARAELADKRISAGGGLWTDYAIAGVKSLVENFRGAASEMTSIMDTMTSSLVTGFSNTIADMILQMGKFADSKAKRASEKATLNQINAEKEAFLQHAAASGAMQKEYGTFRDELNAYNTKIAEHTKKLKEAKSVSELWRDSLKELGRTILHQVITSLVQLGVKMLLTKIISDSIEKSQVATSIIEAKTLEAIWAPVAVLRSLATGGTNSAGAMAGIGATFAFTKGLSAAGFMKGGFTGDIPEDRVAGVVHGREFVVNAAATAQHRDFLEQINASAKTGSVSTAPSRGGAGANISVRIENYGTNKDFTVEQVSPTDVRIIAEDVAREVVSNDAPNLVAGHISNPNSRISKSLRQNINANRRRT